MLQQFAIQYIVSQFCKTCVLLISSSHNTYHNSLHKATAFWKDFCCSLFENSCPATEVIRQLLRRTPAAVFTTIFLQILQKSTCYWKITGTFWSWWPDLNRRPTDYESVALPAELHQHMQLEKSGDLDFSNSYDSTLFCQRQPIFRRNLRFSGGIAG